MRPQRSARSPCASSNIPPLPGRGPLGDTYAYSRDRLTAAVIQLLDAAAKSGAIRRDVDPQDVLLAVAASTWAFANDSDWQERARPVLRLVMDGLRYRPG